MRELFIQCNKDSCCEHITGGVNIYIFICMDVSVYWPLSVWVRTILPTMNIVSRPKNYGTCEFYTKSFMNYVSKSV